jgi:serine/threonine-protein phosphatase 2A activator
VLALNAATKGRKVTDPFLENAGTTATAAMLDTLDAMVDATPPVVGEAVRFGNPAYKTWHAKMVEASDGLVRGLLADGKKDAAVELVGYLHDAFGNATRIDYGSGHELAFLAFVCCKLTCFNRHNVLLTYCAVGCMRIALSRKLAAARSVPS